MIKLYQRNNGIWYVSFHKDGKRIQKSTKTTSKQKAYQFASSINQDEYGIRPKRLQSFITDFHAWSKVNKAAKSVANDIRALSWLLQSVGDKHLDKITVADIERFKGDRLKKASFTTVNIDLRTCKAAFFVALKWGLLKTNPFTKVSQLRQPRLDPIHLTEVDKSILLNGIHEDWFHDLVLFALNTGMRRGEIINLRWVDVDMDKRMIHVTNQEHFTVKGGKGRVIPMNETTYRILQNRMSSGCYVFTNQNGSRLYANYIQHRFKKYVRRLGLDSKLHFHHLRHTFASSLVRQGVPIYEIQHLLGHASVITTQVYAHVGVEELRHAVCRLDKSALG